MTVAKILVIDNYDSFVYNLVQYLAQIGAEVEVWRNDDPRFANPSFAEGFSKVTEASQTFGKRTQKLWIADSPTGLLTLS